MSKIKAEEGVSRKLSQKEREFISPSSFPLGFGLLKKTSHSSRKKNSLVFSEWNKHAESITGIKRKEIIGKLFTDIVSNGSNDSVQKFIKRISDKKKSPPTTDFIFNVKAKTVNVTCSAWKEGENVSLLLHSAKKENRDRPNNFYLPEVLDSISESFFLLDNRFGLQFMSLKAARFLQLSGKKKIKPEGQNFLKLIDSSQLALNHKILRKVARNKEHISYEEYYEPLHTWFMVHVSPTPNGLAIFLQDITRQKLAEIAFLKLSNAVEQSADAVFFANSRGYIEYVNPAFESITGYKRSEALGRTPHFLKFGVDKESQVHLPQSYTSGGTPQQFSATTQNRRKSGELFLAEETIAPVLDSSNNLTHFVTTLRDVTERKRIAEALNKSQLEYRNLFDAANDAIIIFEPETEMILETNLRACEVYGFTKEEFSLLSLKQLTKDIARGEDQIQKLLREKTTRNFETVHFKKNGKPMEMLINSSVVEHGGKKVVISIIRDITEMKHLEHQLRQAQKMESLGTLAGGIAHDFNNILSIIMGYSSMLQSVQMSPDRVKNKLDSILKAGQRGAILVKQILTFARKTEVLFESASINDIIRDVVNLLTDTFPRTINFSLDLADDLPSMVADPNQMHQILMNLCVNAKDAMSNEGVITFKTEVVHGTHIRGNLGNIRQSEYVHLTVSDNGSGISEDTKNRIFEPFFTTKGQGRGTGLGLAVVHGIVNAHRGFIDFDSEPGVGTSFHLYFPIQMRTFEKLEDSQVKIADTRGGKESVLIIEDEEMLSDLLRDLLNSKGYSVMTASDGLSGLELFQKNLQKIDLVITDVGLPRLNGWEVCRKISQINPKTKVVIASGYLDPQVKSELSVSTAKDFIHKPYLPEDVLTRIRKVLDDN